MFKSAIGFAISIAVYANPTSAGSVNSCKFIHSVSQDLKSTKNLIEVAKDGEYVLGNPTLKTSLNSIDERAAEAKKIKNAKDREAALANLEKERANLYTSAAKVSSYENARNLVMEFPPLKELGFEFEKMKPKICKGLPNLPGSRRPCGWQLGEELEPGGTFHLDRKNNSAHVRLDWDEQKGAHFNVYINKDGKPLNYAVMFECGGGKCTEAQAMKLFEQFGKQ